jgi:N utilization substance protein A
MEGLDLKALAQNVSLIAEEKNLSEEKVIEVIEDAIAAAWRRDHGKSSWKVRATLNTNTGSAKAYRIWDVVETPEDEDLQISVADAQKIRKGAKEGETVEEEFDASTFGRVAAQTAKQVVIQKLREAERAVVLDQFRDRIGEILTGVVSRVTPRVVVIEIGKAVGVMPKDDQIDGERYGVGQRIKVLFKGVETDDRGSQMVLSRADKDFVRVLFDQEVPELETGAVEIKGVAREPGRRSKIAVYSSVTGVDPVGTFVGGRGARINAVSEELGDERVDIVVWDKDIKNYISNAIAPAEVSGIELNEKEKKAKVFVTEDQQSIAIGRSGQNVRLASALTGYNIDIETAVPKVKKTNSSKAAESSLVDVANADEPDDEAPEEAVAEEKTVEKTTNDAPEEVTDETNEETTTETETAEETPEE